MFSSFASAMGAAGRPAAATSRFTFPSTPPTITGPAFPASPANAGNISVSVAGSVAPQSYSGTLTVTLGGVAYSNTLVVTVVPAYTPSPSYSLSCTNCGSGLTVTQGGAGAVALIAIARQSGYAYNPVLSAPNLPTGVNVSFDNSATESPTTNNIVDATVTASAAASPGSFSLVVNSWDGVSAYSYAFSIPVTVNGPPLSVSTSVRYTMVNPQTQIPSVTTLTEAATGGVPPYTFTLSRDISSGPVQSAVPLQYLMSGFTSDRHALLTVTDSSASPQTVTKNLLVPAPKQYPDIMLQAAVLGRISAVEALAASLQAQGADPSGVRNAIQSQLGVTAAQYGNTQIGSQSGLVLLASRLQAAHAGNLTASKGAINSFHGGGFTARTASSAALNTLASSYTSDAALSAVYAPEVLNTVGGTPYSGSGYDANAWQLLGPYLGSCDPEYGCDPCDPDFDNCGSGPGSQIVTAYFDTQIVIDNPTGQFVAFSEEQVNTSGYPIVGDSGVCVSVTVSQGIVYGNPPQPVCDTFAYAISQVYGQATQAGYYIAVGTTADFHGCVVDANCYPIEIPSLTTRDSAQFSPPACSPPTIDSIVVNGQPISELVIGSSGTIAVSGACLDNTTQVSIGFDPSSDYAGNSSGVTVSNVTAPGWGVVNANYSVASGTMPETVVLTVTTSSGSAPANLDVVASGPYIDSINPVTWLPGTSTAVTISGSGFGTNQGSLTVTAPNGDVALAGIQSWSDGMIIMNVNTGPSSAGETVTITVAGGTDYGLATGFLQANGPGTGRSGTGKAYVAGVGCGDLRDALILEYQVFQSDLQPTCFSFQQLTMVVPLTRVQNVPSGSTTVPISGSEVIAGRWHESST